MKFNNYIQPKTLEEALDWVQRPDTVVLGGMMWLRMQSRTVENVVDLSLLGLDRIEETSSGIRIGAYVTLRQAETDPILNRYTRGAVSKAFAPIVGVQFRNTATVGGSVFGRFGFSDVTTLFTALGAAVCLAQRGVVPIEEFVRDGARGDLLTHILLPAEAPDALSVQAHRNSATDFPVITTAVCKRKDNIRVTMSPAPVRAYTEDFSSIRDVSGGLADSLKFGSDRAASAEYRNHLARILLNRALVEIGG